MFDSAIKKKKTTIGNALLCAMYSARENLWGFIPHDIIFHVQYINIELYCDKTLEKTVQIYSCN